MKTKQGLTVFCAFCEQEATAIIERSGYPICKSCLDIYQAGMSNPDGQIVNIENFKGKIDGYEEQEE